jgi:FMN-dependent NADH-azoreductase
MKRLLHIIATPREDASRTLKVTKAFLEPFQQKNPEWVIDELNLIQTELPSLTMKRVDGKYQLMSGKNLFGEAKESWDEILQHIERFKSADGYLISSPMWNFCIPYMLKHYIDILVQPKYLFQYTQNGVEGLIKNKKMVVIGSFGGEYVTPETQGMNLHEPYLRTVFGYVGITDIRFIIAQGMDMSQRQQPSLEAAKTAAQKLGNTFTYA